MAPRLPRWIQSYGSIRTDVDAAIPSEVSMQRSKLILLVLVTFAAAACNRPSAEELRARDLALALQDSMRVNGHFASPGELGAATQQNGQWVYIPAGYVLQPMGQPTATGAPAVYRRTAATSTRSSGTVARAPRRVTHIKRDAMVGAAVGTVAGAAIGRDVKSAVIGAAAGGALGAVVGATVDVDHR